MIVLQSIDAIPSNACVQNSPQILRVCLEARIQTLWANVDAHARKLQHRWKRDYDWCVRKSLICESVEYINLYWPQFVAAKHSIHTNLWPVHITISFYAAQGRFLSLAHNPYPSQMTNMASGTPSPSIVSNTHRPYRETHPPTAHHRQIIQTTKDETNIHTERNPTAMPIKNMH